MVRTTPGGTVQYSTVPAAYSESYSQVRIQAYTRLISTCWFYREMCGTFDVNTSEVECVQYHLASDGAEIRHLMKEIMVIGTGWPSSDV